MAAAYRICFVCLGNICRSPTAEAILRRRLVQAGLHQAIEVESAGTGSWHVGHPPDERAGEEGRRRGIVLSGTARQFERDDFERVDLVLAMDRDNHSALQRLAPHRGAASKVRLLLEFSPSADGPLDVPDPYYGGADGFAHTFEVIDSAMDGLLEFVSSELDRG